VQLRTLRSIATVEAVGGALSLVGLLTARPTAWPGAFATVGVAFALLGSATSVIAGVLLWRASPLGRGFSLAAQAAQIPRVALPGIAYALTVGAQVTTRVLGGALQFDAEAGVHGALWLGHHEMPSQVGVNLLALALFVALRRATIPGRGAAGVDVEVAAPAV
jgi:hypothetical protein